MGLDLVGHGGFSVNWGGWEALLDLAHRYGWSPAGTVRTEYGSIYERASLESPEKLLEAERSGYFSNDGNLVTAADASSLAAALRRALVDPNRPAEPETTAFLNMLPARFVEKFAAYCEKGEFRIL